MVESGDQIQMVTFKLGVEQYGIDVMDVKEIYRVAEVRPIPNVPAYIEGMFNLRGEIIPIVNLQKKFSMQEGLSEEQDETGLSGFIVVNGVDARVGITIKKILKIVSIDIGSIQPPPPIFSGIDAQYIQGVASGGDGYLIILNIRKIFSSEVLRELKWQV